MRTSDKPGGANVFLRALLAFLALPGLVAFAVPLMVLVTSSHTRLVQPLGLIPLVIGLVGLLWCVRDFYVAGKGTLAPWSPPSRLVVAGLYRYSRNPMYIAVTLILVGWGIAFASPGVGIYAAITAIAFHIRVVSGEEPFLASAHGEDWTRYRSQVRRWV